MNGGNTGYKLVSGLAKHANIVTLQYSNRSGADYKNQVGWNNTGIRRDGTRESVLTTAGMRSNPVITLGHELAHVDFNWNIGNSSTWFNMTVASQNKTPIQRSIPTSEIYTTHIENQLRSENNLPLRSHYGIDPNGNGVGPRIIMRDRSSRYYNSQGITNYTPLKRNVAPYIY